MPGHYKSPTQHIECFILHDDAILLGCCLPCLDWKDRSERARLDCGNALANRIASKFRDKLPAQSLGQVSESFH